MKKSILLATLIIASTYSNASDFFYPSKFDGSSSHKSQVISFIKGNVHETYSAIGMGDPVTLRMMEKEELNAFKRLTKVDNKPLLSRVIKQYCDIGMCNYSTIYMMYKEQNQASSAQLTW